MTGRLTLEAVAYGYVPAQVTVAGLLLAGRSAVVPVGALVLLLVAAHGFAPLVFVLARSDAERNLDLLDEQYESSIWGEESPDPESQVDDLGSPAWASVGSWKLRAFLYCLWTLVLSLLVAGLEFGGHLAWLSV